MFRWMYLRLLRPFGGGPITPSSTVPEQTIKVQPIIRSIKVSAIVRSIKVSNPE